MTDTTTPAVEPMGDEELANRRPFLEFVSEPMRALLARLDASEARVRVLEGALQGMVDAYWRGSEDSDDKHAPKVVKAALAALAKARGQS